MFVTEVSRLKGGGKIPRSAEGCILTSPEEGTSPKEAPVREQGDIKGGRNAICRWTLDQGGRGGRGGEARPGQLLWKQGRESTKGPTKRPVEKDN